ncbi:ABC transporter substrate-binding protein [Agarilytica rhodophyticola]|uniref:ABC transporter substrate-binding protein n=1 Tax=Agarilytica rhodophyticola TaxID=1737490 RepID=UPI001FE4810E|nr:ABC transporter substrate-binding protein [Agarilytica rhodophyticola]
MNNLTIKIALDADWKHHQASANSIEMGIRTAFDEIDNIVQNYSIEFVPMDHRGNVTRSKLNMKKAFADPDTLLVMAGMHSPPLIKNRTLINEQKMLTLVPWAAGGPITRYPSENNWVFRLSIDDTRAGLKIAEYAINERACKTPHLLLEQTPWGESNRKTMTHAVKKLLNKEPSLTWYNWSVSEASLRIKLRSIIEDKTDCILFVGNANDGKTLMHAMLSMENKTILPILSHWGITGGEFHNVVDASMREKLDLTFIQTCFSFVSSKETPFSQSVFKRAQKLFPELRVEKDLQAPVGFIHAYDLGKILIQALQEFSLVEDMDINREKLKLALENLESPVQGLVKNYSKPFSVFTEENDTAHEALDISNFCMARYGEENEIIVMK